MFICSWFRLIIICYKECFLHISFNNSCLRKRLNDGSAVRISSFCYQQLPIWLGLLNHHRHFGGCSGADMQRWMPNHPATVQDRPSKLQFCSPSNQSPELQVDFWGIQDTLSCLVVLHASCPHRTTLPLDHLPSKLPVRFEHFWSRDEHLNLLLP